ncbi:aldo/keto reductase [Dyella sp. M7H15-1]|uniref:aldo/keto reductase n=1 Tax=Dyella sp. M7H15-1 TaxID=2501295 RepID=UPI00100514BD|nr:aldo/keto reductase [Dyella sp. M7H15-1]QAU24468.1 aldo/keto reductase [Dyella sp. M7H15-1]
MQRRQLGHSGLSIAPLAFGGNVFGWSADEQRSFDLLDAFVDAGFNLIDTADVYAAWAPGNRGGESETIIGKWLKRSGKRDKVIVATKVAKWVEHRGLSPMNINQAIEGSLQRLQTDHIDLYQAHEDDASVPLSETLGAFGGLIEQGKVRAIGASNYHADRLADALQISKEHNLPRYESLQPEYNLVSRASYEQELEPLIRRENIGVINYYALASGFLSGKYRSEADLYKSSARGSAVKKYLTPQGMKVLAVLDEIAAAHKATPSQIALAWLTARPGITAPIASATRVEQLHELLGAASVSLAASEISALNDVSAGF